MLVDLKNENKLKMIFFKSKKKKKEYVPIIEHLIGILVFRKVNNTFQPIHFSFHQFVHNLKKIVINVC